MLELLADPSQRKLVVLGDPGSGKSLLLQYLVLAWADANDPLLGDAPLPLLIELRDYASRRAKGEVSGFLDYLGRSESLRWITGCDTTAPRCCWMVSMRCSIPNCGRR
jgi:GTPase SAR1 family protein